MVYPGNFIRLVASGTLYGAETFSFGLSIIPNFTSIDDPDPADYIDDVATAVGTYFNTVGVDNSASLTLLKLNMIGPNGRYVSDDETVQYEYDPPVTGNGSGNPAPQVALAISLMTDRARGRAHMGRFYLPVPSAPLAEDGRITVALATLFATGTTTLLDNINAAMPTNWDVGVASDVGTGAFEPVRRVRVGRVLDTIRSRRRSLDEAYVVGPDLIF